MGLGCGYRFVCAEGLSGASLIKLFNYWFGNSNYAMQTINTRGTTLGNDSLVIDIKADYSKLTNNISVASGAISHGNG